MTAFVVSILMALILLTGLVLDGGSALATKVRAAGQAEAAARAGAQAIDLTKYRTSNHLSLVPSQAAANAHKFLSSVGAKGSVVVTGNTVTVTVDASQPAQLLGFIGISSLRVRGTGRALPQLGVTAIDR
ncbi:pilus assembly protein TadG-related protein [Lentzea sp. JNUCC 0626]|uniref:pilus assembly protein TadG-related protein n=1 Tax=Lentzea sp. JNUCC 0626 TaxID=3367513 RepID=UPI00374A6A6A